MSSGQPDEVERSEEGNRRKARKGAEADFATAEQLRRYQGDYWSENWVSHTGWNVDGKLKIMALWMRWAQRTNGNLPTNRVRGYVDG